MSKFLFTMWPANDLGLPSRLVPIARLLADRGHEVAMFNPAPAPGKLIADAGLTNLPMPALPVSPPMIDLAEASVAWDAEQLLAPCYNDEAFVASMAALYVSLISDTAPDVVVDSFELLSCLAARVLEVPLVTVLQGSFHPESRGFLWWTERPKGLPSAAQVVNRVAAGYGLAPAPRCIERMAGDLCLIVGTPETDPLPAHADVDYVGPIAWQRANTLPDWIAALGRERPLVWIYSGNPRYASAPTPIDSIVVIRAGLAALADAAVNVVLTTGYQELPPEFGALPANFRHAAYVPGIAMAERADLMVHHGGHGSVMTGLMAGTPQVIIPTISERACNARSVADLGAGEMLMPTTGADGEKQVDAAEFHATVERVLHEPSYRKAAQRVADSMRTYGGAREAADRIERFTEESRRRGR